MNTTTSTAPIAVAVTPPHFPRSPAPTAAATNSATVAMPNTNENRFADLAAHMEALLSRQPEVAGDRDRQRQRRVVTTDLDRIHRLPGYAERLGKQALRQ